MTLGSILRTAREGKGMSQAAVAAVVGISRAYISDLERDHRTATDYTLGRFARALDLDMDWLLWTMGRLPEDLRGCVLSPEEVREVLRMARGAVGIMSVGGASWAVSKERKEGGTIEPATWPDGG